MRSRITSFAILFCFLWPNLSVSKDTDACLSHLHPLEEEKIIVGEMGGMWTLFEQSALLRDHSTQAIQSDSKMNQLFELLQYLCATVHGVPFNELAVYLYENLKLQSKQDFKKEHLILGKSEAEIDIWLAFFDVSLQTQKRQLELSSIETSIRKANPLFREYKALALEIRNEPDEKHLKNLEALNHKILNLESSDNYLKQAWHELAQVPFWDIDENYGGS